MTVITRFAPSPTGFLHIGSARTALFNYLFSKHHNGKFLLRIEDTDRARSTEEAIEAIFQGLDWLGLGYDEDPVFQFERRHRHVEVAKELHNQGNAYYCSCTSENLQEMREKALKEGRQPKYDGRCREKELKTGALRLKAPTEGKVTLNDLVQGPVTVKNAQIDDMVLLRADGSPTYMLSVVVDDHDMHISHIIRGDDHLTNAFRQYHLYNFLGWKTPEFSHIPLIHGPDGAKLSKRHGALGVEAYAEMGYLPEAMRNYLLRLGWGHGDDEIISDEQAIKWFTLENVGKSPARFDFKKLESLNAHYIKTKENAALLNMIQPTLEEEIKMPLTEEQLKRLEKGLDGIKQRARFMGDIVRSAMVYIRRPETIEPDAKKLLTTENLMLLKSYLDLIKEEGDFSHEFLHKAAKEFSTKKGLKLVAIAQPLRALLTGSTVSPGIFDVMEILGKTEVFSRADLTLSQFMLK